MARRELKIIVQFLSPIVLISCWNSNFYWGSRSLRGRLIPCSFFGQLVLGIGSLDQSFGYPKKGILYEPLGRTSKVELGLIELGLI